MENKVGLRTQDQIHPGKIYVIRNSYIRIPIPKRIKLTVAKA